MKYEYTMELARSPVNGHTKTAQLAKLCEFVINEIVLETHAVFCLHVMTKNNPTWESLLDLKRKICEIMTLRLYVIFTLSFLSIFFLPLIFLV